MKEKKQKAIKRTHLANFHIAGCTSRATGERNHLYQEPNPLLRIKLLMSWLIMCIFVEPTTLAMKKFVLFIIFILSLLVINASCQKGPYLSINGDKTFSFTEQGGTHLLTFSCNSDWFISSSEPWCFATPSSGMASEDGSSITITCEPNTIYDARTCALTINIEGVSEIISIEQESAYGLILSQSSFEISAAAQPIEVTVQANVEYSATIDPACEKWITRVAAKSLSSEKLTFNVFENTDYDERVGHIIITQKNGNLKEEITVRQAQKDGLVIDTQQYVVSEEAQSLEIQVKANVQYDILPEVEWVKYIGTKALNSSTATLSIEANGSTFSRTGKVAIKQNGGSLAEVIIINQQARPEVKTEAASGISFFGASLNGTLVVESAAEITENVWFLYSSTESSLEGLKSSGTKVSTSLSENGSFTKELSGLNIGTTYYYVACAIINGRDYYGNVKSFVTTDLSVSVVTGSATEISFFTCQLNGTLKTENAEGFSKETWFLYSSTYSNLEQLLQEGTKASATLTNKGQFSSLLTDLNYATEYYYVACAKVHDRFVYGEVKSFTTSSFSADVTTSEATSDKLYKASLNGSVIFENAGAFTKSAGFLYGVNLTTIEQLIKDGVYADASIDLNNHFNAELKGLKCGTLYHYVAWVKVHDKVFYGDVMSFTSCALPEGAVDMGLSVAWASCDIDALTPEEIGGLYAWGETETKPEYNWGNYKWGNPYNQTVKKYNDNNSVGKVDNLLQLLPEDDVAHLKLGNRWRMPTKGEAQELIKNCTWVWMEYNGVMGNTVTSNITGNKIFLPALKQTGGEFWTSSHFNWGNATVIWIKENGPTADYGSYRYQGLPIRPVTE